MSRNEQGRAKIREFASSEPGAVLENFGQESLRGRGLHFFQLPGLVLGIWGFAHFWFLVMLLS